MIDIENLRRRIGQEFENECHLTAAEARLLFDMYEAACTWRDTRGGTLWIRDQADDRLIASVDSARRRHDLVQLTHPGNKP